MRRRILAASFWDLIDAFFSAPPDGVKAVVLTGTEGHFCSGLDLAEHTQRNAEDTMRHSRGWHAIMDKIQYGGLPVVSAMFGAVIGALANADDAEAMARRLHLALGGAT